MGGEGIRVIRSLLLNSGDVLALVPGTRIQADALPEGGSLSAILLEEVTSVPYNTLSGGASKHFRDKIQVTPHAKEYVALQALVKAIFSACADQHPTIPGLSLVSVFLDSHGPDGISPVNMARVKPMDFIVSYNV